MSIVKNLNSFRDKHVGTRIMGACKYFKLTISIPIHSYFGREVLTDIPAVEETVAVSNFELPSYVYLLASAHFAGVLYHLVLIPKLIYNVHLGMVTACNSFQNLTLRSI